MLLTLCCGLLGCRFGSIQDAAKKRRGTIRTQQRVQVATSRSKNLSLVATPTEGRSVRSIVSITSTTRLALRAFLPRSFHSSTSLFAKLFNFPSRVCAFSFSPTLPISSKRPKFSEETPCEMNCEIEGERMSHQSKLPRSSSPRVCRLAVLPLPPLPLGTLAPRTMLLLRSLCLLGCTALGSVVSLSSPLFSRSR